MIFLIHLCTQMSEHISFYWKLNCKFSSQYNCNQSSSFNFFFHFETMIINCQFWNIFQINFFANFNQSSYFLPQEVLGYFSNDKILTEKPLTNCGKILHISWAIACNELMFPIGSPVHSGNTSELPVFPFIQFMHCVYCYILEHWIQTLLWSKYFSAWAFSLIFIHVIAPKYFLSL